MARLCARLATIVPTMVIAVCLLSFGAAPAQTAVDYTVTEAGIEAPLTGAPGDPERGRGVAVDPQRGNCLICHTVPDAPEERFQGNIGPPLAGAGARHDESWLRLRVVDGTRLHPDTVMPAYHRVEDLNRVAAEWRGRPVLTAAEVEDVVAWLVSLKAAP